MCDPVDVPVPGGRLALALLDVMPARYTWMRKPVAVIEYGSDPPVDFQCEDVPARLLVMIGALVKPHPDKSISR